MASTPAIEFKCLFCFQNSIEKSNKEAIQHLFSRDTYLKTGDDLESNLSVFFMLKNVLCLPTPFLEELLKEYGSPVGWKLQLCRACCRLFTEAEYLWDKIRSFRKEFDKVTYEIKDVLVNSISPKEGEALMENANDLDAHKAVIKEQLLLRKVPLVESVRAAFFLCLHEQSEDDLNNLSSPETLFKESPTASTIGSNRKRKLTWHETGIPFVTLADLEKKMKDFNELVTSLSTSTSSAKESLESFSMHIGKMEAQQRTNRYDHRANNSNKEIDSNKQDEDEVTIIEDRCISSNKTTKIPVVENLNLPNILRNSSKRKTKQATLTEHDNDEAPIRIVNTSSLTTIQCNEKSNESNVTEALPEVLGIIKHDLSEINTEPMEIEDNNDSDDDPLALDNDPDYEPGEEGQTYSLGKEKCDLEKAANVPEDFPSKLRSLQIVPLRRGKSFECSKCQADFETRKGCQSHILKDHYGEKQPYHCHICRVKYDLFFQLIDHVSKCHGHVRTPYDDDFDPNTDFIKFKKCEGRNSIEEEKEKPEKGEGSKVSSGPSFACPVSGCTSKFQYKSSLNKHTKHVHNVKLLGIEDSNAKTDTSVRTSSNDESYLLQCEICSTKGMQFKALTKDILDIHLRMRHGLVKTSESRAKKKIANNVNVTAKKKCNPRPQIITAKKSTGGSMKCPDCGLVLPTASAIVDHLKNPENKCTECSQHFLFDTDLKKHLELDHADRRAFQCPYCPKTFSAQTIYEKHIDNHQKFDVHECDVCHEKLTGFSTFTGHMETHTAFLQAQMRQDPEIFGF